MLAKRIIPCLDVTAGRVVKGVNFVSLRDAGDPVEIARRYDGEGADELTFLDITASSDQRDILLHMIEAVAEQVFIPLTVGGGVRTGRGCAPSAQCRRRQDLDQHRGGAEPAARGRRQRPLSARSASSWRSTRGAGRTPAPGGRSTHGGRTPTGLDAVDWARRVAELGAGEILLTSMDRDGTRQGFDLELTRAVADAVSDPGDRRGGVGTSSTWPTV
jgi:cyclase